MIVVGTALFVLGLLVGIWAALLVIVGRWEIGRPRGERDWEPRP